MRYISGMTLLEIVVTLTVVSLLAAFAAPPLADFLNDARRTANANALVAGIHFARQSAIRRAEQVVMCKSTDGLDCRFDGTWGDGWIVFVNAERDSPPRVSPSDTVLQFTRLPVGATIRANRRAFVFRPFRLRSTNGTFVICDRRGSREARAVVVSVTGRPRVSQRTAGGRDLRCA